MLDHHRHGVARARRAGRSRRTARGRARSRGCPCACGCPTARSAREMRRTCEVPVLPAISTPGRPGSAARAVPRAPCTTSRMPAQHDVQGARPARRSVPARLGRRRHQPGRDGQPAIAEPGRHDRELQRRRRDEALADAADQGLALLPALAQRRLLPRRWSGSGPGCSPGRSMPELAGRARSGRPWRRWRRCRPGGPGRRSRRRRTGPAPGPWRSGRGHAPSSSGTPSGRGSCGPGRTPGRRARCRPRAPPGP